MTPEEEAEQAPVVADDKDRMAKLMEAVPEDGSKAPPEPAEPQAEIDLPDPPPGDVPSPDVAPPDASGAPDPTQAAPAPPEPTADDPQDDYEREIEAIRAPKGASTNTENVLKILKAKNREEHRAKRALEQEKADFAKKKLLDPGTEAELTTLRSLRDQVAIEQSPAWNTLTEKVLKHEAEAMSLLQRWNLPADTAKLINDTGGLLKFQESDDVMPQSAWVDNKPITHAQWWEKVVDPMLTKRWRTELGDSLSDARRARRERDSAVAEAKGSPDKFFADQKAEWELRVKDFTDRADKQSMLEADIYGDIAKPRTYTPEATPEQKKEIDAHNAKLAEFKQQAVKWVDDQTPEGRVSMALARVYRDWAIKEVADVKADNAQLRKENTEMKSKWDKAKGAAQTTRQQATLTQQKSAEPAPKYDPAESIKRLMEQIPA